MFYSAQDVVDLMSEEWLGSNQSFILGSLLPAAEKELTKSMEKLLAKHVKAGAMTKLDTAALLEFKVGKIIVYSIYYIVTKYYCIRIETLS